jgi:(1->4)-alpha-D-glucan 1-alpha-D-glucosylmutase
VRPDSATIEDLLRETLRHIDSARKPIESTYRVQLHANFAFRNAEAIVPYLADLGITHLYASPYLKAQPGSTHGYDVIDHCRLNPELGSTEDFEALVATLAKHGMTHIADIVPNHVGIATNQNAWWNDLLENGPSSPYAGYFDVNWAGSPLTNLNGRVLVPVLGEPYGQELEKGNLRLVFENGKFFVCYYERKFPISPATYSLILGDTPFDQANAIHSLLNAFNGIAGKPSTFDRLDNLLRKQHFRLAFWKTAPDEINYRRFFDVNSLAALSMERLEVFEATHGFILGLLAQNKIAGLRVDHPDGLHDPQQYFRRLQSHYVLAIAHKIAKDSPRYCHLDWKVAQPELLRRFEESSARPLYILGEKILALDEPLVKTWQIDGTTGYDFLNMTNGLFVDTDAADQFSQIYANWIGDETEFNEIAYHQKKMILEVCLASELNMLSIMLKRIAGQSRYGIDFSLHSLQTALKELIACFGVYRTFISANGASEADRYQINRATEAAISRNRGDPVIFDFIRNLLLSDDEENRPFAGKFQQLTSPVTAKGIEDTSFYIYNRLLSLNEVGGDPSRFGVNPQDLHAFFLTRQRDWPRTMNTLSTHDTKRSEDVRARLNAISEMPDEWQSRLQRWSDLNARHRTIVEGCTVPDRNEEYAIYQTLLGAWPLEEREMNSFSDRIRKYMLKFMREARVHTHWTNPNKRHEDAVDKFLHSILDQSRSPNFLADFQEFQRNLCHLGMINSLAQTLLKLMAPGVPDTYQGNELWDFSLVDPDNRRPVDFQRRMELLRDVEKAPMRELLKSVKSGRIKLALHQIALKTRNRFASLFTDGEYIPIEVTGTGARHAFAFARANDSRFAIVVVPRLCAKLITEPMSWPCAGVWKDTSIVLPEIARNRKLQNHFAHAPVKQAGNSPKISLADLLRDLPFALLIPSDTSAPTTFAGGP